jgi:hypothetical protein
MIEILNFYTTGAKRMSTVIDHKEWLPQLIELLNTYYVFPEKISAIEDEITKNILSGQYDEIEGYEDLTPGLQRICIR